MVECKHTSVITCLDNEDKIMSKICLICGKNLMEVEQNGEEEEN